MTYNVGRAGKGHSLAPAYSNDECGSPLLYAVGREATVLVGVCFLTDTAKEIELKEKVSALGSSYAEPAHTAE